MNPVEDNLPLENSDLLAEIVRALVDVPEQVQVEEKTIEGGASTVLIIKVAKEDRGKIIGKNGSTIYIIRGLFNRIGSLDGIRLLVEVEDDSKGRSKRPRKKSAA